MITQTIKDVTIQFNTDEEVFSPKGADTGTLAMLSYVGLKQGDKVLDLGCGYGIVGIWAAKQIGSENVVMCDISEKAVAVSKQNAIENQVAEKLTILQSDGLKEITEEGFTYILSNPPYHVDFAVPKHFIEDGYKKLAMGGKMLMVTKRKDWYQNKLTAVFGGVTIHEKDGYYIFSAEKRVRKPKPKEKEAPKLSKKLQRKYKNKQ